MKFIFIIKNLLKYIKRGGVTYTNIDTIGSNELLKGKTALITGGSSGIGLAIAKKYLKSGANILITGRNENKLIKAKELLSHYLQNRESKIEYLVWDVKDISLTEIKFNDSLKMFPCIDIFVNNAGIFKTEPILQTTEETWNDILDINLKGLYFLLQHEISYLIKNKIAGHIINISSMDGIMLKTNPYSVAKNGVNYLTRTFAKNVANHQITINAIAPGAILTDINLDFKNKMNGDNDFFLRSLS